MKNCVNCKHFRCRCVNIDSIDNICELSGKILPLDINEKRTKMLIPDCCPLINKERRNKK